jgi:hypothetical protein
MFSLQDCRKVFGERFTGIRGSRAPNRLGLLQVATMRKGKLRSSSATLRRTERHHHDLANERLALPGRMLNSAGGQHRQRSGITPDTRCWQRRNWGCAPSRAFREGACGTADTVYK